MAEHEPHTPDEYTVTYDREPSVPASDAVISAVSSFRSCGPLDLEPLFHRVEPDALDQFIAAAIKTSVPISVVFDFATCSVEVTESATIISASADDEAVRS